MNVGDFVKIKDRLTGEKVQGRIAEISTRTEAIETTFGWPPPDQWREFVPGATVSRLVIEVDGVVPQGA